MVRRDLSRLLRQVEPLLTGQVGPRSFLSFASPPGIEWVNSKIGSSEFGGVANRLISGFTSMLKINSGPRSELAAAEPLTADIAWQYSKGKQSKPILFLLHPLDFSNPQFVPTRAPCSWQRHRHRWQSHGMLTDGCDAL